MVQRTGSRRRKTRSKLKKNIRTRGKIKIRDMLQKLKEKTKVILVAEPGIQGGMHHPRFQGRTAEVMDKQGSCYRVKMTDGKKEKTLIVHPVHLRKND